MARLRLLALPCFVIFLVLCYIGASSNRPTKKNIHFYDRADRALLAHRNTGHARGLKYFGSPTGTASSPAPTETCYDPPSSLPASQVDVDELCKCSSYLQYDENPNLRHNVGYYGGWASCWSTCVPQYSNQTLVVDANESFSQCINACDASFEKKKAKRTGLEDYWFCHGVNFIQGKLCEFVGAIAYTRYLSTPGVECYNNGLTPTG